MQRGTCTFRVKALNAQAAGASAAVIFNRGGGDSGPINETLGSPGVTMPAVGTSFAVGQELYSATSSVRAPVVTGAYLDSVTAGGGIVDNGSGSAALLEIALNLKSSANMFKTGGNGSPTRSASRSGAGRS